MPYITKTRREMYDKELNIEKLSLIETKGDLEYLIFKLMKVYMQNKSRTYSNLHDTVYAAQHCADEFRRRFLDKREDEALELNGDI